MKKKIVALMLALNMLFSPAGALRSLPVLAATAPPVNTLPQQRGTSFTGVSSITTDSTKNQMVINQSQKYATINWNSFNIGANAVVNFNQKNAKGVAQTGWVALNRIYDQNASQIFGKLTADGKVYLINQNGILFGKGSQVNVNTLIASTLNLRDKDFQAGLLRFTAENYQDPNYKQLDPSMTTAAYTAAVLYNLNPNNIAPPNPNASVTVENDASITAGSGGRVCLIGPSVINGGTITAQSGIIDLIGVTNGAARDSTSALIPDVEIKNPDTQSYANDTVYWKGATPGTAFNNVGGSLIADSGRVYMYGKTVTQNGLIRAITTVKKGGQIYLAATDEVITGAESRTDISLSNSTDKVSQSFKFYGGTVKIWGLTTTDSTQQPLATIDHFGDIEAPSSNVELDASKGVYLENGSTINVGGVWVDEAVTANLIQAQLNGVNLADYYGQKNGILRGQTITTTLQNGSSIGDISGAYTTIDKTTWERGTKGGTINIGYATQPDVFVQKEGATLDFSGGGLRYAGGMVQTTKLLSGNTVYDISNAPAWLKYQSVFLGQTYSAARIVGSDAGALNVNARNVFLGGKLDGSVTQGPTQTAHTTTSDYDISVARGLEAPVGGKVTIGNDFDPTNGLGPINSTSDYVTKEIEVMASTSPYDAQNPPTVSELSAEMLSNAGLSSLSLYANTGITIDAGARISLRPGGSFIAKARRIDDSGEVYVPGGTAEFTLHDNVTSLTSDPMYTPVDSALIFNSGSVVSARGLAVDNSNTAGSSIQPVQSGTTSGGQITIQDLTSDGSVTGHNLTVASGASLDVSGGYQIDQNGNIAGGNAGAITLKAMNLALDGDFQGLALPGKNGGTINLHAGEIEVVQSLPDSPASGTFYLAQDRFSSGGFTSFGLKAINNITFDSGSDLEPSTARLAVPMPGGGTATGSFLPPGGVFTSGYLGQTSITATAGSLINGMGLDGTSLPASKYVPKLTVATGATVGTAPGGSVSLTAPTVDIAGTVTSQGGSVTITANSNPQTYTGEGDLTISGSILARGYNEQNSSMVGGQPVGLSPQSAGSISLTSTYGSITLNPGARLDVSGAESTINLIADANDRLLPVTVAGNPGSLSFRFEDKLVLNGDIAGNANYAGVQGGTLSVERTHNNGLNSGLDVTNADMQKYLAAGFDSLTFKSIFSINFSDSMDNSKNPMRRLVLDAPTLTGSNDAVVNLNASWVSLESSTNKAPDPGAMDTGTGILTIHGGSLDATGSLLISGFHDVNLVSDRDLTFADWYYGGSFGGNLGVTGNLTLTAERIYPTTASNFTVTSMGIFKTVANGTNNSPIYSAGGNLTIIGDQGIDQEGVLAAPLGSITLESDTGRVYLANNSVVTTAGGAQVYYGNFDGTTWSYIDPESGQVKIPTVTDAPGKTITINGNEVIVGNGAKIDFSGGGSVFTYLYQPDLQGTTNPISTVGISALTGQNTRPNRYVILPDNSVQIPGFTYTDANGKTQVAGAVYLNAMKLDNGTWLKAGTYSLLPEQFAFIPGALIISDLGKTVTPGLNLRTAEGYQVDGGSSTYLDTGVRSNLTEGYSIRSAADVLQEGNFSLIKQFVGKNAGTLEIRGNTTVMAGSINAAPLSGGKAGSFILSGTEISVQENPTQLPPTFDFTTTLEDAGIQQGTLQIAGSMLSGSGLGTLTLGDTNTTSIIVTKGSTLSVPNINLVSSDSVGKITIESGATVEGVSDNLTAGTVDIQSGGVVNASSSMTLDANDGNLQGALTVNDHGSMNLASNEIFFVSDSYTKGNPGLYLTQTFLKSFANCGQVMLTGRSDLNFQSGVTLTAGNVLTLDTGTFNVAGTANVVLNAGNINMRNSTGNSGSSAAGAGVVTLNADNRISINGTGDIAFNGAGTVNLRSNSDLTLQGSGTLNTGGDLNIAAARVTTTYYRDATDNTYHAADFTIVAAGAVNIMNSGGTAGTGMTPGGSLTIEGSSISINQSGIIEVASGQVNLSATAGDISLSGNAQILAQGSKQVTADPNIYDYTPGGQITLSSSNGNINLAGGSVLDVSAADKGSAGAISLSAPAGVVAMNCALLGNASAGYTGGSFTLDTNAPSLDLTELNGNLQSGGFTEQISIRARRGNLTLAAGQILTGDEIMLEADGADGKGNIYVNGTITATDGTNGGRVELYAQNNLMVNGSIVASGAAGGEVFLGSEGANGMVTLAQNGVIDVHGTSGTGGSVTFRAQQNTSVANGVGVNMAMPGTIIGASQVVAEAFKVYAYNTPIYTINSGDVSTWMSDASNYIGQVVMPAGWNSSSPLYHFRPGIEIQNSGDITLPSNFSNGTPGTWNLADRFAGEPGVLTLRAAKNLNISASMVDDPTSYDKLYSSNDSYNNIQNSWGINLVAGADLNGASPLAVNTVKTGNLTINSGNVVYSENAPINFAAGNNVIINSGVAAGYMLASLASPSNPASTDITESTMLYTLASYGGTIRGRAENNLTVDGGAIQTATGDIYISAGGDLDLQNNGAIRTTGEYAAGSSVAQGLGSVITRSAMITDYWTYHGGGSIRLDVGGSVNGFVNSYVNTTSGTEGLYNDWDYTYGGASAIASKKLNKHLSASFEGANSTAGIATMGGGDIFVRTGGSFNCQIGAFGTSTSDRGDLVINSGGDITGRFRVMNGTLSLNMGGNFGSQNAEQVIELGNAKFNLTAQGDVYLGAVLNPDNSRINLFYKGNGIWNLTYGTDNEMLVSSQEGNVVFSGTDSFDGYSESDDANFTGINDYSSRRLILPASVTLLAAGDVLLQSNIYMAPSPQGELSIYAGNNVSGYYQNISKQEMFAQVIMNDRMDGFYGYQQSSPDVTSEIDSTQGLIHTNDSIPVVVNAGNDIMDLQLDMAKMSEISAGRDINELQYLGQNIASTDVTSITAGRDILYSYIAQADSYLASINPANTGIRLNGPGVLLVQAGRNIELGSSAGIQSLGNQLNSSLGSNGSDILVAAGAAKEFPVSTGVTDGSAFFNDEDGLKYVASDYMTLLDEASKSSGAALVTVAEKLIKETPDLITQAGKGNIGLTLAGNAYATLLALSKNTTLSVSDQQKLNAYAQQLIVQARNGMIKPWFDAPPIDGSGSVNLTNSRITTLTGADNIYILTRGDLNVGKTTLGQDENLRTTGIYTNAGGSINIYSGGDVNVNESRVMTFLGGNIDIWSDKGSINAGRGSKSQVAPPTILPVTDPSDPSIIIGYSYTPPAVGSGIRALTFDPNLVPGGPIPIPAPGDIYLFAPQGVIDAGEAGIAGGRVVTGATEVLNAKNISFSVGSVGVPSGSGTSVNLGALAGAGSVAETSKMVAQASALGGAKDSLAQSNAVDQFLSKFLEVKVIDFDTDNNDQSQDTQDEVKRKKK